MRRVIAMGSILGVLAGCGGQSGSIADTSTTAIPPTTGTTEAATTTTTDPTSTAPDPDQPTPLPPMVLMLGDGDGAGPRIVLIDGASDFPGRTLADENAFGEGAGDLAVSPDGQTVFFSRVLTACASEIVGLDISDGSLRSIAGGEVPTPSPDGRFLAYVIDPVCRRSYDLVIRDLETGVERTWQSEVADAESEQVARIPALSWSPDGSRIAFELELEDGRETRIIEVSGDGGDLADAERPTTPDAAAWISPVFRPDGILVVVEVCCGASETRRSIVEVDPSGRADGLLYESETVRRLLDTDGETGAILVLRDVGDGSSEVVVVVDGRVVVVAANAADAAFAHFGP